MVLTICILALIAMWNLQFGREMEVYNSFTTSADNFEMASLNVVVNRLFVPNKEKCANEILQHCIKNDFKNILFSYDYAIPNELKVDVYLAEWDIRHSRKLFSFEYVAEDNLRYQYNILDDTDKFQMFIRY